MALKLKLASQDGLPEGLAKFVKPEGSTFVLDLPDGYVVEDITPLRAKRDELLEQTHELKTKLAAFSGIDAAAVKTQLQELAELKAKPKGGGAEAVAEAKRELAKEYEQRLAEAQTKLAEAAKRERGFVLGQAEAEALRGSKHKPKRGVELLLRQEADVIEENGTLIPVILNPKTGKPRYSPRADSQSAYMTFQERLEELAADPAWGHLFEGSGMKGNGVTGNDGRVGGSPNPFNPQQPNLTEQLRLAHQNPDLAATLKAQAQAKPS